MAASPVRDARLFNPTRKYSQVDWASFPDVIGQFKKQLRAWYIAPARVLMASRGHYSFAALSVTCTLIDTLSQFYYGREQGRRSLFLKFCRTQLPQLRGRFVHGIPFRQRKKVILLRDPEAALYHGVRCGVVHEAHPSLFTAISGTGKIWTLHPSGLAEFSRNGRNFTPCPTVVFDPGPLLEATTGFLRKYLSDLQGAGPANLRLRRKFARKFYQSFGIKV